MKAEKLTDLELLNKVCEAPNMINPKLLRDIESRGLYNYIKYLPSKPEEAKAMVYGKLSRDNKVFRNEEIDWISGKIGLLKRFRKSLNECDITDSGRIKILLKDMTEVNEEIIHYFK